MQRERVIVFMPGTSHREARYFLPAHPERGITARCSPRALIELQEVFMGLSRPRKVLALTTEGARKKWRDIQAEFDVINVDLEDVPILGGADSDELMQIVKTMLAAIPDDCDVTLDITHGFRSTPFVFTVAVQYLSFVRRDVKIDGPYYAMFDSSALSPAPAPFVDMKAYLELMEWLYAARVFHDTLVPDRLSRLITAAAGASDGSTALLRTLSEFSTAIETAIPSEIGSSASELLKVLDRPLPERLFENVLMPAELFGSVRDLAVEFVPVAERRSPQQPIDQDIAVYARLIEKLLNAGRIAQAAGVMREWTVLMTIRYGPNASFWPSADLKEQAEKAWFESKEMWKVVWDVRQMRNYFYHHGTLDEGFDTSRIPERIRNHWAYLKSKRNSPAAWRTRASAPGGRSR